MSWLRRLFGRPPAEPKTWAQHFPSEEGAKVGASKVPFVVYGNYARETAQRIASDTTMSSVAVVGLDELERLLDAEEVVGLLAMSRVEASGEAGEAIRVYRRHARRPGPAFYGAWDYNVDRAAARAVEYGADGIAMPGILVSDEYAYMFGVMAELRKGSAAPASAAEHRARLERWTTKESPFWSREELVHSQYY